MKTALKTSWQTQWTAVLVAAAGTLLSMGGPLTLAEHYAQTGASWSASGYYAAVNARRNDCPAGRETKTAEVAARSDVAA